MKHTTRGKLYVVLGVIGVGCGFIVNQIWLAPIQIGLGGILIWLGLYLIEHSPTSDRLATHGPEETK